MSESRGMGREALVYTLGSILTAALGFGTVYVFSRMLSPHEFGYYFMVLSGVELASLLGGAWINQTTKRFYPAMPPAERPQFMGRVAGAYALTAIVMVVAALLGTLLCTICAWPVSIPWMILIATVPSGGINFAQWQLRIHRLPGGWLLTQVTMMGGRLLFGWLVLQFISRSGAALLLAFAFASLVAALAGFWRLREPFHITRDCFGWRSVRGLMDYGIPLTLVNGGVWLINSAGRLILGWLAGPAAVGIYATAQQLAIQLVQLPVTPILTAADPLTIHVYEREGAASVARYLRNLLAVLLLLGAGVALTLYLLRELIVGALLDPRYKDVAKLMGLLTPAIIGWLIVPVLTKSHELANKTRELSWFMLGAGALNVSLNFLLIPLMPVFKPYGVAIGFLATYTSLCLACYISGRRHLLWQLPYSILWPIGFASGVLLLLDTVTPHGHGLLAAAGLSVLYVFVYLAAAALLLWLLRKWYRDEVQFFKHIFELRKAVKDEAVQAPPCDDGASV